MSGLSSTPLTADAADHFDPLEQTAFPRVEHAASLKGFLKVRES